MSVEVVGYSAPDGEGRHRRWEGVRKYTCPNGCSTGFYDFRRARLADAAASDRRARRQQAAWTVTSVLVGVGLVVMYALFMYAIGAVPVAGWVRPVLWVLTTLAFGAIGALLVLPPRAKVPADSSAASPDAGDGVASEQARPVSKPAGEPAPSAAAATVGRVEAGAEARSGATAAASSSRQASG